MRTGTPQGGQRRLPLSVKLTVAGVAVLAAAIMLFALLAAL